MSRLVTLTHAWSLPRISATAPLHPSFELVLQLGESHQGFLE